MSRTMSSFHQHVKDGAAENFLVLYNCSTKKFKKKMVLAVYHTKMST